MKTGRTDKNGKLKELRLFEDNNYIGTVYARKIRYLYNYAKDNNINIVLKNH